MNTDTVNFEGWSKREIRIWKREHRWWSLGVYPVFFYLPETGFGFGAFANYAWKMAADKDSTEKESFVSIGGAYTTQGQLLLFKRFNMFWGQNKNFMFGENGYQRYFYYYFGMGNNTKSEDQEPYDVNFPRVRVGYTRQIAKNLGLGVSYWFEYYDVVNSVDNGLLQNVYGGDGGLTSGLGPLITYDSRDNIYYPTRGWFAEGRIMAFGKYFGSEFNFYKGYIDATNYQTIHKNGVFATNMNFQYSGGNVPFHMMSTMGGFRQLRGYYEGRFREYNSLLLQVEYRLDLWWRLGMVAFADAGQVYDRTSYLKLNDWRWTVGAGLRFALDVERNFNFRIDYGIGRDSHGFYLTVGEAF